MSKQSLSAISIICDRRLADLTPKGAFPIIRWILLSFSIHCSRLPDVPVSLFSVGVASIGPRGLKPFMLCNPVRQIFLGLAKDIPYHTHFDRCVVERNIDNDLQTFLVGCLHQTVYILDCSVRRVDLRIVPDIIPVSFLSDHRISLFCCSYPISNIGDSKIGVSQTMSTPRSTR